MKLLGAVHQSQVVLCTIPGETPFTRHTLFPSDTDVYRLEQILDYFTELRQLTLHVPEYVSAGLPELLDTRQIRRLAAIETVHVNVLNQNIDLLPPPEALAPLRALSTQLTMTTAHRQYCTLELSRRYRVAVHHLAVPIGVEQYVRRTFAEKDDLVLFSPDDPARNREVAQALSRHWPRLEAVEIRGLPYHEYRRLLERARWTFTFGEGLDYYFVESVFSGGIAFAVYNDRFFTPELASLETVYPTYDDLLGHLDVDFGRLSEESAYAKCQSVQLALLADTYGFDVFRANLERFLVGDYTWPLDEATGTRRSR